MGRQAQMIATAVSVMFQIMRSIAVSVSNTVSRLQTWEMTSDEHVKSFVTVLKLGTRMKLTVTPLITNQLCQATNGPDIIH